MIENKTKKLQYKEMGAEMTSANCLTKNNQSSITFSDNELSIILKKRDNQMILQWKGKSKSKNPGEKFKRKAKKHCQAVFYY